MIKQDYPILEFDPDPDAVLKPDHEHMELKIPEKVVFAFLGETIDKYAAAHKLPVLGTFISMTKNIPVYQQKINGEKTALVQAPVGAPVSTMLLDWLIAYGARKIISAGSCGVLEKFPENYFLIPSKALRDEGTSYHYAAPSKFIETDESARKVIEKVLTSHGLKYKEVTTWTTDGFFRETRAKISARKEEGCLVVEMECSALAACAKMRGASWGEILFTGDTLADIENYDERRFGMDSHEYALQLCFEVVKNM